VNGERTIRTETRQGRNVVSESSRTQTIPREYPAGALGEIRVSHGRTIKTGDFESVRVDVSVTLPCDPNAVQETIAEAHDHVVDAFIAEEEYLIGYANPTPARRGSRRG
jgi:hypothetical protein